MPSDPLMVEEFEKLAIENKKLREENSRLKDENNGLVNDNTIQNDQNVRLS